MHANYCFVSYGNVKQPFFIVNPSPTPSVTIAASSTTICQGTGVTFTATQTNGGTMPSYQWKKNGNTVGNNTSSYNDSTLAQNDVIACVLTSNATCASPLTDTSNTIMMTVNNCTGNIALHLKLYIEGYYLGNGMMKAVLDPDNHPTLCDSVTIELRQAVSPYGLVYSVSDVVSTSGNGTFLFPAALINGYYFLVIKHRNSLAAWSKNAITFSSYSITYDMTAP